MFNSSTTPIPLGMNSPNDHLPASKNASAPRSGFITINPEAMLKDFTEYLEVKATTLETYKKGIRKFFQFMRENQILLPERHNILAFRKFIAENNKANTTSTYMAGIRRFFSWTAVTGLYPNIAQGLKGPKASREFKKDCLSISQAKELLASVDQTTLAGKRDYAILALMLSTGLRDCEVIRANIEDMTQVFGELVLYVQGKGRDDKDQFVKITDPVEKAIRQWLKARGPANKKSPLFCSLSNNRKNGRLTTRSISRLVKTRLRAIGIDSDRITAHSLRHSAATMNMIAGGTIEETQRLLRHSQESTTRVYVHFVERAKSKAEDRISKQLFTSENEQ